MFRGRQNILYIIIIVVVAVVLYLLAPQEHYKLTTHGSFLSSVQQEYTPVSVDQVKVYSAVPSDAVVIGRIYTHQHFSEINDKQMKRLQAESLAFTKKLAAQHGANGIVPEAFGYAPSRPGPLDFVQMKSQAIRVD